MRPADQLRNIFIGGLQLLVLYLLVWALHAHIQDVRNGNSHFKYSGPGVASCLSDGRDAPSSKFESVRFIQMESTEPGFFTFTLPDKSLRTGVAPCTMTFDRKIVDIPESS